MTAATDGQACYTVLQSSARTLTGCLACSALPAVYDLYKVVPGLQVGSSADGACWPRRLLPCKCAACTWHEAQSGEMKVIRPFHPIPRLQVVMQRLMSSLWLPPAAVLEWLEQHTQIRLSILLTYLFGKSEAFVWVVKWCHNFARVSDGAGRAHPMGSPRQGWASGWAANNSAFDVVSGLLPALLTALTLAPAGHQDGAAAGVGCSGAAPGDCGPGAARGGRASVAGSGRCACAMDDCCPGSHCATASGQLQVAGPVSVVLANAGQASHC